MKKFVPITELSSRFCAGTPYSQLVEQLTFSGDGTTWLQVYLDGICIASKLLKPGMWRILPADELELVQVLVEEHVIKEVWNSVSTKINQN